MTEEFQGASSNERLIQAARTDNYELLQEVFAAGNFDINYQDGLGNTALHYCAMNGSVDVIDDILTHEECDVDPTNLLERATPLHFAVQLPDEDIRVHIVGELLDAGADTRIKNKYGQLAIELLPPGGAETNRIRQYFVDAEAEEALSEDAIARDDDDDGEASEGSEE